MKIMSYNILRGGQGRQQAIAEIILHHQPDVVMLQEATDPVVVKALAAMGHFDHVASRANFSVAALSHRPIRSYHWHPTVGRNPILEVALEGITIWGVHLISLLVNFRECQRLQEIQALIALAQNITATPHLLIGDFNAISPLDEPTITAMPFWLRLLITFNGGIKRDALAFLLQSGYRDVFREVNWPDRSGYTMPTPEANSRLDYVFVPLALSHQVKSFGPPTQPASVFYASDHFPILVEYTE